jgi:hypothetical protein
MKDTLRAQYIYIWAHIRMKCCHFRAPVQDLPFRTLVLKRALTYINLTQTFYVLRTRYLA